MEAATHSPTLTPRKPKPTLMAREAAVPDSVGTGTVGGPVAAAATKAPSPPARKTPPKAASSSLDKGTVDYRGRCGCECGCARMDGLALWCRACKRVVLASCCGGHRAANSALLCHLCATPGASPKKAPWRELAQ